MGGNSGGNLPTRRALQKRASGLASANAGHPIGGGSPMLTDRAADRSTTFALASGYHSLHAWRVRQTCSAASASLTRRSAACTSEAPRSYFLATPWQLSLLAFQARAEPPGDRDTPHRTLGPMECGGPGCSSTHIRSDRPGGPGIFTHKPRITPHCRRGPSLKQTVPKKNETDNRKHYADQKN